MHDAQTIPAQLQEKTGHQINIKFLAGGLLLLIFVLFLGLQIVWATTETGAYYMTVDELVQANKTIIGQQVRVNGTVMDESEDWQPREMTLKFSILDENGTGAALPIVFYGPRPDNFQRAASAIVEGRMLEDGTFQADNLLLKCPSRYEEEPEEIYAKAIDVEQ